MQCLKHGLDFLLGEWVQLQLKLRGWISSFRAMSISSPKKKKLEGFYRMKKSKTAVLRPKVCTDKLEEMETQGGILLEEYLGSQRT